MKTRINHLPSAVLALLVVTHTANAATQVYDLKADWSDTQNPNGPGSFHFEGGELLSNDPFPWTVWYAPSLGSITRITESDIIPGYLELGDVYVSTWDYEVAVRWTASANGTINVSSTAWGYDEGDIVEGSARWTLKHNGNALSSGLTGGTRNLPYDLSSGSGGVGALQNIAVQAGDQIELAFQLGSGRTAVNFTITLTTDSVDPVGAIETLALTVVDMNLQNGIENSLDSKLDAAVAALNDTNANNDAAACNSLAAFICAVEAQRGNKITHAQADQLIAAAQQIQSMLNCGN